jgi:nucleotide-binding universal stress UspA family protein
MVAEPSRSQQRIVVAYDGSPSSRAALERARTRAEAGDRVIIVHSYEAHPDPLNPTDYPQLLVEAKQRGEAMLAEIATGSFDGVRVEMQLLTGPPAKLVANVAEACDATDIIIGTRGHGLPRALIGSVAHELLHLAACPVTVIPERAVARRSGA